jgi:hypothetical protein
MGHCISVYLLKQEDIRDNKITEVLDKKEKFPKVTHLGANIYAATEIPNFKEFSKGKEIGEISTDYFGGAGSQAATLWKDGKKFFSRSDEDSWSDPGPINELLKSMGVVNSPGMDEFDTINLGRYRSNRDFE